MNPIKYFEIQTGDPKKAVDFYSKVFGWKFAREENLPIEYYRLTDMSNAGMMGAILERPMKTPPPGFGTNAFVCSMQVQSFDETSKRILENGGMVALPKFAIPGRCWQGYFIDIDGTTFGIFEVDEKAK